MSRFIRNLNLIKKYHDVEWLTPSQQRAFIALKDVLHMPCTVNMYGSPGVGKTFLAWVLANQIDYDYFPHFTCFIHTENTVLPRVIIDNADPSRKSHRDILKVLQFREVNRAILITRELIHDYTRYIELSLSSQDWTKVHKNLASIGFPISDSQPTNLWGTVNPSSRRI